MDTISLRSTNPHVLMSEYNRCVTTLLISESFYMSENDTFKIVH